MACATQWRIAPMGGRVGLDYSALESVIRLYGIAQKRRKSLLTQVRHIEVGALSAWQQKHQER